MKSVYGDKIYMTLNEVSEYLNIKEKTLYAMVSSAYIPHYRIGRLIRFKKEEIDAWMETRKVVRINPDQKVKNILRSIHEPSTNIDKVIKKIIDQTKRKGYIVEYGKSDRIEGPKQEVEHGSV